MKKGESILVKIEYDLFGNDMLGKKGIYVSTGSTGKLLIFFPKIGEWGEFSEEDVKRTRPNFVSKKNKEFIGRTKRLVHSLD